MEGRPGFVQRAAERPRHPCDCYSDMYQSSVVADHLLQTVQGSCGVHGSRGRGCFGSKSGSQSDHKAAAVRSCCEEVFIYLFRRFCVRWVTLLGAGAGSGCEHCSWRLEAQIRPEVGGSGWPGFAADAYLSQKVSSKFHLHSQISCLFFCRGTNRRNLLLCNTLAFTRGKPSDAH